MQLAEFAGLESPGAAWSGTTNAEIAEALERTGALLEVRDANPFRVRSYMRAADELRALESPVRELYASGGRKRLREIPGIGAALSSAIAELVETGRLGLLERLESAIEPERAFQRLPGIGAELARRIHDELGVSTLEELERAAYDGRLVAVEGIGEKRARGIRDALAGLFARSARRRLRERTARHPRPPVSLLLAIDEEYRSKARAGELRRIAPRRFNPEQRAWLPVMEVQRKGWEMTALFSNAQRAHELGRTYDWVVIYYDRDSDHGQCTVVTARKGRLAGRRVVRGREPETRKHYGAVSSSLEASSSRVT